MNKTTNVDIRLIGVYMISSTKTINDYQLIENVKQAPMLLLLP